jgi:hypothetical protein
MHAAAVMMNWANETKLHRPSICTTPEMARFKPHLHADSGMRPLFFSDAAAELQLCWVCSFTYWIKHSAVKKWVTKVENFYEWVSSPNFITLSYLWEGG